MAWRYCAHCNGNGFDFPTPEEVFGDPPGQVCSCGNTTPVEHDDKNLLILKLFERVEALEKLQLTKPSYG